MHRGKTPHRRKGLREQNTLRKRKKNLENVYKDAYMCWSISTIQGKFCSHSPEKLIGVGKFKKFFLEDVNF